MSTWDDRPIGGEMRPRAGGTEPRWSRVLAHLAFIVLCLAVLAVTVSELMRSFPFGDDGRPL